MVTLVRRAKESDIPTIMELLKQVNLTHYNGRPDLFNLTTKYTEDELRTILNNDQTPPRRPSENYVFLRPGTTFFNKKSDIFLSNQISDIDN